MKKLVTMALLVASIGLSAQEFDVWRKVQTSDQFGDPTGEWMNQVIVEGFLHQLIGLHGTDGCRCQ